MVRRLAWHEPFAPASKWTARKARRMRLMTNAMRRKETHLCRRAAKDYQRRGRDQYESLRFYNRDGDRVDCQAWDLMLGMIAYRRVQQTMFAQSGYRVSTVFIGHDPSDECLVYETLSFRHGEALDRKYTTTNAYDARKIHALEVLRIAMLRPPPPPPPPRPKHGHLRLV